MPALPALRRTRAQIEWHIACDAGLLVVAECFLSQQSELYWDVPTQIYATKQHKRLIIERVPKKLRDIISKGYNALKPTV
jgi:hypothetical protein